MSIMDNRRKTVYWTISLVVSAVLIVLIGLRLYKWNQSRGIGPNVILSQEVEEHDLDIVFGPDSAKLTVFMYSNYACKFCKKFFEEVIPALQPRFESGEVRIVMKLVGKTTNELNLLAQKTAVCVNEHGNYESLHKLLSYNYMVIFTPEFKQMVDEFIDKDYMVGQCILEGEADDYLEFNNQEFDSLGFRGTPVFVIGPKVFIGYRGIETFMRIINLEVNQINNN